MFSRSISNPQKGFTLIELLIVITVLVILAAMTMTVFTLLNRRSSLENNTQEIINILRTAQSKAVSSESASRYGVYFNLSVSPHQYTLFKGNSYASRDSSFDIVQNLSRSIEIYELNLSGAQEVVFSRVTGEANPAGNVKIRAISDPSQLGTIYIKNSGQVDLVSPVLPSVDNLEKDSRHVHFDLGWSIQDAVSLKFYFPDFAQTETVNMANYFNPTKTEFTWEGKFTIGGADQIFKVHTHLLDPLAPPYTRLCVHRDRNNGENNQKVTIFIADGGVDKEIGAYQNDSSDTVVKGAFSQSLERQ